VGHLDMVVQSRKGVCSRVSRAVREGAERERRASVFERYAVWMLGAVITKEPMAIAPHANVTPLVFLMALPHEETSFWGQRTMSALNQNGYNWLGMRSVDAVKLGKDGVDALLEKIGMRVKIPNCPLGALGCWASHLMAWHESTLSGQPVISLEADTAPTRKWLATDDLGKTLLREYDIVFLHEHPRADVLCKASPGIGALSPDHISGTGAMLFTNRDSARVWSVLRNSTMNLPIGQWLQREWQTRRRLRIARVCPGFFWQHNDHNSSINVPMHKPHASTTSSSHRGKP
jgi:hypothetical protein